MIDIYEYFQDLKEQNVLLAYKGDVNDDLFNSLLQTAEKKLDKAEDTIRVKKKIFNILVELLQNIYHHFDAEYIQNEDYYSIIFLVTKIKHEYTIFTGNYISKDQIEVIQRKIDQANALKGDALRNVYREKLENGVISAKGAGLGFLDIVRKSGQPIGYEFKPVNNDFCFFCVKVHVSIK